MKRKLCCLLLTVLLIMPFALPAAADEDENLVDYSGGGKLSSDFAAGAVADTVNEMQPGDNATFTVTLRNTSNVETDWYMLNDVTQTMERDNQATGGAYAYRLTYQIGSETEQVLYDSDRVNGGTAQRTGGRAGGEAGLSEAVGSLKDYFYLDTLAPGDTAKVTLTVGLDGETQGNVYQNRNAMLLMNFAVEENVEPTVGGSRVVIPVLRRMVTAAKTNDAGNLTFWLVMLLVSAALVVGLLVFGTKKHGKGGAAHE